MSMNPEYPIYIISKGRWKNRLTARSLEKMNVPYKIVIEPQEFDNYSAVMEKKYLSSFHNITKNSF